MNELGIFNGADLANQSEQDLVQYFGKAGLYYYKISQGIDEREVKADRIRKSVGAENTYASDINDISVMHDKLMEVAETVERRLQRIETAGRTVTLKVRYGNFEIANRSITMPHDVNTSRELYDLVLALLPQTEAGIRSVRLLGITVSNLTLGREESAQLNLGL